MPHPFNLSLPFCAEPRYLQWPSMKNQPSFGSCTQRGGTQRAPRCGGRAQCPGVQTYATPLQM
jgi:hypothetical protein